MGRRANFVIVREGRAAAYFDNWAGLGAAYMVGDGPDAAQAEATKLERAGELLDWAFAEGGYLLDFDRRGISNIKAPAQSHPEGCRRYERRDGGGVE